MLYLPADGPSIHVICTLICLPCGKHYRSEIGLVQRQLNLLPEDGIYSELEEHFPEVMHLLREDHDMNWSLKPFVSTHEDHDIRFINTVVSKPAHLVALRAVHFKKMLQMYKQYHELIEHLQGIQTLAEKPSAFMPFVFKPFTDRLKQQDHEDEGLTW